MWSDLQKKNIQRTILRGSKRLKIIAKEIFDHAKGWAPGCPRIDSG
jgi:hypothetical protein